MLHWLCFNIQIVVNCFFNLLSVNAKYVLKGVSLCVVLGLCSCHTALYNAAERGDVATVKQEIAKGASALQINEAADVAYQKGNAAVLAELAQAGAAVAPDSMAGKSIVLQADKKGETTTSVGQEPYALRDPDSISPGSVWKPVKWIAPAQDDYCRLRELKWQPNQANCFNREWSDSESDNTESQTYKRLGRTAAVVTDSSTSLLHGGSFNMFHRFKYELAFESPTHGIFCAYDCEKYCNVVQLMGRFWLKDLPVEPEKKPGKK